MSVVAAVKKRLAGDTSWRAQTALILAAEVDKTGSAAASRELRTLMDQIENGTPAQAGDAVDQLAQARRSRRAASGVGSPEAGQQRRKGSGRASGERGSGA